MNGKPKVVKMLSTRKNRRKNEQWKQRRLRKHRR